MSDCIEWTRSVNRFGYGRFTKWDKVAKKPRAYMAHRVEWEKHYGPIPAGLHVMHSCDNRRCINIEHLSLGTPAENTRQKMERNRHRVQRGEKHGLAKLTESQVRKIRTDIDQGVPLGRIARINGVARSTIKNIKDGVTWRHVG